MLNNNTYLRSLLSKGVFAVNKVKNMTSVEVLEKLKKILLRDVDPKDRPHHLRLGHGGTLDSTATGVLVVGIGWGCKVLPKLLKGTKKYVVTGHLGTATETYNETGKVIMEKSYDHISLERLEQILQTFEGRIYQIPPKYSALKFHGRRIADLIREGKEIEMKPRPVFCYSVECVEFTPPNFKLKVSCGGGFYIRSLIHDIGLALDSCAHVTDLRRTQHGPFTEEDMLEPHHWTVDHITQAIVMAKDKYYVELQRPRGKICGMQVLLIVCQDQPKPSRSPDYNNIICITNSIPFNWETYMN
ncbi:pseudouridylate synthase TRUB1 isoform X2 [Anabrus simplex]|uniref:pseudouridylate synthase TRUB1 isoform X2 n=1 Tax=Anabrus simplex TaxID=316456 RepID=UPI0035A2D511